MSKIYRLEELVKGLYLEKNKNRADWADWLFENHVLVVADYASDLAKKYKASEELSRAAALLHDIADTTMKRNNPSHDQKSMEIARGLMQNVGYTEGDVSLVVDDALRCHSCHGKERPSSVEGKILATADSLAHLKTDFYIFATKSFAETKSLSEIKDWVLNKIERDFHNKVLFDDVREDVRGDYNLLKELYSR